MWYSCPRNHLSCSRLRRCGIYSVVALRQDAQKRNDFCSDRVANVAASIMNELFLMLPSMPVINIQSMLHRKKNNSRGDNILSRSYHDECINKLMLFVM